MDLEALKTYFQKISTYSKKEISEERDDLYKLINGDVFYDLKSWPAGLKRLFWKKPTSDVETFQLMLFLYGNGCEMELAEKWIVSSLAWCENNSYSRKRLYQINWIYSSLEGRNYNSKWYFFDIHKGYYIFLDGKKVEKQDL